jgi:hypothetical protein
MRFAFAVLPSLFLSALLHAQNPPCLDCPKSGTDTLQQSHAVCLAENELAAHIATRKPIAPPGLNEPHMNIEGTVKACLCFMRTGEVTQVSILSGPPMMQQSVLESLRNWTFRPVMQAGRRQGGCGTLRLHVVLNDSQVRTTIEN